MKIKAAVSRAPGEELSLETLDMEEPRDNEILVRLVATGVCHTDLVVRDQDLPTPQPVVLGHEGAGVVERIGSSVTKVRPGDHVVMTYNSCGRCPSCLENEMTYCHHFFDYNFAASREDGTSALSKAGERVNGNFFGQSSFANLALCTERNVVPVRNDVPLKLLGPLACGIQTGAGAVLNALKLRPGQSFAVFGAGSVGLSAVMAAKVVAAKTIIAVDLNDERLNLARELGATHCINPKVDGPVDKIMEISEDGLHCTLDTTGLEPVIRDAALSLSPRGVCGVLGASALGTQISLDEVHFMSGGRRLMGIVEGESVPDIFIPTLIDLYQAGQFPFDRLITFYPFERINEAIHDSEAGKVIKPVLEF